MDRALGPLRPRLGCLLRGLRHRADEPTRWPTAARRPRPGCPAAPRDRRRRPRPGTRRCVQSDRLVDPLQGHRGATGELETRVQVARGVGGDQDVVTAPALSSRKEGGPPPVLYDPADGHRHGTGAVRASPAVRLRGAARALDRGRAGPVGRRAHVRDDRPGHRGGDLRGRPGRTRGRRPRGARRPRGVRAVGEARPPQARGPDLHARGADQGEPARACGAGVARQRQAGRVREGRRRRRRQPPALLRRLADQDRGRDDSGLDTRRAVLHAQGAGRRMRADHPVELPAADGDLEARPRAGGRLHRGPEAGRADAAHRAAARRAGQRGAASRRASSTSSVATARRGRRSSTTRTSTRSPSPARPRSAGRSARSAGGP